MFHWKMLSLCMIVKDEEACLETCLESVKDIVDEMVIVDTGSVDRTKAIAASFGARILDFPWADDFAAARNHGIEQACGDWILWMDADEQLEAQDRFKVREILYMAEGDLVSLHLINYYGSEVNPDESYHIAHTRLFRNHRGIRFENRIHEALNVEGADPIPMAPVRLHHYGYLDRFVQSRQKLERNLRLLERELEQGNEDPWIPYHLASEYFRDRQYERSFQHINIAIIRFISQGRMPPSLLYKLKYSILLSHGSAEGAWPGIQKAIELYPDYVDLHYYKGLILFAMKKYAEALDAFEQCVQLGETHLEHLVFRGCGSFHAWYRKGLCQEKLGLLEEAACSYEQSAQLSPTFAEPVEALQALRNQQGYRGPE